MTLNTPTLPELTARPPRVAILPIGAYEQHGAHLPYTTDTLIAQLLASHLAPRVSALLLPPLPFSCSHEHAGFPFAVSLSLETLAATVRDVLNSLERDGIELLILLNGHGGNYVLGNVAQELNQDRPRVLLLPQRQHWEKAVATAELGVTVSADMHGGAIETSLLMHAMPEVVRSSERRDHEANSRPWLTALGMRHYTASGIIGFPERASAKAGERLLTSLTDSLAHEVSEFLTHVGRGPG